MASKPIQLRVVTGMPAAAQRKLKARTAGLGGAVEFVIPKTPLEATNAPNPASVTVIDACTLQPDIRENIAASVTYWQKCSQHVFLVLPIEQTPHLATTPAIIAGVISVRPDASLTAVTNRTLAPILTSVAANHGVPALTGLLPWGVQISKEWSNVLATNLRTEIREHLHQMWIPKKQVDLVCALTSALAAFDSKSTIDVAQTAVDGDLFYVFLRAKHPPMNPQSVAKKLDQNLDGNHVSYHLITQGTNSDGIQTWFLVAPLREDLIHADATYKVLVDLHPSLEWPASHREPSPPASAKKAG